MAQIDKKHAVKALQRIPGVGISIAHDLWNIGITDIDQLIGEDPIALYNASNKFAGVVQDRCLLYVFRCAVYFAQTPEHQWDPKKLKWWNWKTL